MTITRAVARCALVFALSAGLSSCGSPAQREARYLRKGIELFNQGEYDKARLEFKNAGAIKPTDPEVSYRIGLIDEAQGELRNAFGGFYRATEQDGHYKPALLKLAQYYLAAEQYDEVQARLTTILTDDPSNADAHALRGALALRSKNFDVAEAEAKIALNAEPGNVIGTSVLVGLYVAKGDEAHAVDAIEAGLAKNPRDTSLLVLEITMYRKLDKPAKVIESYHRTITQYPGDRRYRLEFAQYLTEQKRLDEADAAYRDATAALPEDWGLKQAYVGFLSNTGGLPAAEKQVRAYIAAYPKKDDLYFWLVDLYVKYNAVDQAVALLNEVVTKDRFEPQGLSARTSLARINFARGNREVAQKLLALVLEKDPANHDALYLRAGLSFDTGQYQSAVSDLRAILHDVPRNKEALQLLAETLVRQGRVDLAVEYLSQLVEVAPYENSYRVRLAQMQHLNGNSKDALEMLGHVVKAAPTYSVGWESIARIAIDIRDWAAATAAIDKLAALDGQEMTAEFLRGQVALGQDNKEEAIRHYVKVISANPASPLAGHALPAYVDASRRLGHMDTAAHFVETLKSDNPLVETVLAECYAETGNFDAAGREFKKAVDQNSDRPETYLEAARFALRIQKAPEQAIAILRKGAELIPNDIQLPLTLADVYGLTGRHQEAVALYEDMLTRNPGLDVAANNMAEIIADYQFQDPQALERARRVAERFQGSSNPLFLDTLGWVYFRQGAINQAIVTLEKAVASGEVPAQVHYHYGTALAKLGRKDQAKVQLELATKGGRNYVGIEEARKLLQSL